MNVRHLISTSAIFTVWFVFATTLRASIEVVEAADQLSVRTSNYELTFDKSRGYELAHLGLPGRPKVLSFSRGGLTLVEEPEFLEYRGTFFPDPTQHVQAEARVAVDRNTTQDGKTVLRFTWTSGVGAVEQTWTFVDGSPRIDIRNRVQLTRPTIHAHFRVATWGLSGRESGAQFLPDAERTFRLAHLGKAAPVPDVRIADHPRRKLAFGLGSVDTSGASYTERMMRGANEGFDGDLTDVAVYSRTARWDTLPGELSFDSFLLVGSRGDRLLAAADMPKPDRPQIERVWPDKVVYQPHERAMTRVMLFNPTDRPVDLTLVSEVVAGIDERQPIDNRPVTLAPDERKLVEIEWDAGTREYGLTFRCRLLDGERELDRGEEYTAVTDFAPKVGQLSTFSPGNVNSVGSEAGLMSKLREEYVGLVEYYCWMPEEVLDLTPAGDSWDAYTESQMAYRAHVKRAFVERMMREANSRGVRVLSMQSLYLTLPNVFRHPELATYTANGQPHIWNSRLYPDGERYAVCPGNIFSDAFVERWATEMADSVDMFGWSGVRFDCGFLPAAASDPLLVFRAAGDQQTTPWYDHRGRSVRDLFPDPEAAAVRFVKAWRKTVAARHPNFIYGCNYNGSVTVRDAFPEYFEANCTDALVLFEYLVGCNLERFSTWERWADHLVADTQRVREHRGQPVVGYMRGLSPGGTALRMSQYLMFAAGTHWGGDSGQRHGLDDTWERFRYALRFSEYFYDPAFETVSNELRQRIKVAAHERVLWEPFMYQRPTPGGQEITVHLLNLPADDRIVMHHERPAAKRDITVSYQLDAGESIRRASALLPLPVPHAVPLNVRIDSGVATITLDVLTEAAIIVIELAE